MRKNGIKPILMIGFDAGEPALIERWIGDGTLPNMRKLYETGICTRLSSTADWLSGTPWPTFFTGTTPAEHGMYGIFQWRADLMKHMRLNDDWFRLRPFWYQLGLSGIRTIAIDVPFRYNPEPFNGVEVTCWSSYDKISSPSTYPVPILNWVNREFGNPPMGREPYGLRFTRELLYLRDELVKVTHRVAELTKALMSREKWDLFIVILSTPHQGGHKLWDHTGTLGKVQPEIEEEFSKSLRDVYKTCDEAVEELVKAAGRDVTKFIFSLHGMGPNTDRSHILPLMIERILSENKRKNGFSNSRLHFMKTIRELIPLQIRHRIKSKLPLRLQDQLSTFWRDGMMNDWSSTPAFCMMSDNEGYVRLNVRGRESAGIIERAEEYNDLCNEITDGLTTFVDAFSGEPLVDSIIRSDEIYSEGRNLYNLPDIIVRWASSPSANHTEIRSHLYGSIPWPTPGRNPGGRSGNHRSEGFLLAVGENVESLPQIKSAHIIDLAPTIFALLNVTKPEEMSGSALLSYVED